jgi:hypothetical protein
MSVTRARQASPLPASVAGRSRKTRLRREHVYAVVISLLLLAAIVSLAPYMGNVSPPESKPEDLHQGKIILRGDDDQCMQAKFDNDSGKIGKGFAPCGKVELDEHGVPVPQATVRRLDSISKSFNGR